MQVYYEHMYMCTYMYMYIKAANNFNLANRHVFSQKYSFTLSCPCIFDLSTSGMGTVQVAGQLMYICMYIHVHVDCTCNMCTMLAVNH